MNILFVTQALPNADGAGWERRAAQHIGALCRIGRVTVLLPWRAPVDFDPQAQARCLAMGVSDVVQRIHPPVSDRSGYAHAAATGRAARMWHALRRPSYLDARVGVADRAHYRTQLAGKFDVVFAFKLQSAIWIDSVLGPTVRPAAAVVDFDDIESRMFEIMVTGPGHTPFWRWKLGRQLRWLRATERRMLHDWSAACVCSALDATRMHTLYGKTPWIVPNGYAFGPVTPERTDDPVNVLFVGTFGYAPNVEGVRWFVLAVWPRVRAATAKRVTLTLAGFTPPESIRGLGGRDGITVIADAPDVAPLYDRANIVIAPLLAGSGTRIKLIEAAARGRAIVTTGLGCEGLDLVDGVHAEIADTPEDFAARMVALASDPGRRRQLADTCLAHARPLFDIEQTQAKLAARIADQLAA